MAKNTFTPHPVESTPSSGNTFTPHKQEKPVSSGNTFTPHPEPKSGNTFTPHEPAVEQGISREEKKALAEGIAGRTSRLKRSQEQITQGLFPKIEGDIKAEREVQALSPRGTLPQTSRADDAPNLAKPEIPDFLPFKPPAEVDDRPQFSEPDDPIDRFIERQPVSSVESFLKKQASGGDLGTVDPATQAKFDRLQLANQPSTLQGYEKAYKQIFSSVRGLHDNDEAAAKDASEVFTRTFLAPQLEVIALQNAIDTFRVAGNTNPTQQQLNEQKSLQLSLMGFEGGKIPIFGDPGGLENIGKFTNIIRSARGGAESTIGAMIGLVNPEAGIDIQNQAAVTLQPNPEFQDNPLLTDIPQAVGSTFPMLAAGPAGAHVLGPIVGGGQGRVNAVRANATALQEALNVLGGAALGTLEGRAFRGAGTAAAGATKGKIRQFLSGIVIAGGQETITETGQNLGVDFLEKILFDHERKIGEGIERTLLPSFATGGLLAGAGSALEVARDRAAQAHEIVRNKLDKNLPLTKEDLNGIADLLVPADSESAQVEPTESITGVSNGIIQQFDAERGKSIAAPEELATPVEAPQSEQTQSVVEEPQAIAQPVQEATDVPQPSKTQVPKKTTTDQVAPSLSKTPARKTSFNINTGISSPEPNGTIINTKDNETFSVDSDLDFETLQHKKAHDNFINEAYHLGHKIVTPETVTVVEQTQRAISEGKATQQAALDSADKFQSGQALTEVEFAGILKVVGDLVGARSELSRKILKAKGSAKVELKTVRERVVSNLNHLRTAKRGMGSTASAIFNLLQTDIDSTLSSDDVIRQMNEASEEGGKEFTKKQEADTKRDVKDFNKKNDQVDKVKRKADEKMVDNAIKAAKKANKGKTQSQLNKEGAELARKRREMLRRGCVNS